ncbi:uncharacterized protein si:dkey-112e17.1 [Leucoraja erinacea]|uniref:uncharacterized protein si:dkey-112e17.1 n=1 Tax=Leucoraja erinaceus TaxID=7782 RepID=UPI0024584B03|nr:uncharacterized protein si:dkey-112e17.1 [Leucoraja erinacea]
MAGQVQRIAALLIAICSVVATARSVYSSCGAVVDSEAPGVILSPGFPTNYAAGTHCVWQFFIPPGDRLRLEVFDFDVFERAGEVSRGPLVRVEEGDWTPAGVSQPTGPSKGSGQGGDIKTLFNEINASDSHRSLKVDQSGSKDKVTMGQKGWNTLTTPSVTEPPLDGGSLEAAAPRPNLPASPAGVSDPDSQPKRLEVDLPKAPTVELCPDDVLYISDLVTFSVRFCGANSPVNETLSFGSPLEMVEVVVELITSTGRGRGFLLLYHTERGPATSLRWKDLLDLSGHAGLVHSLLIGGIALLLALLLTAVCRNWRKRTRYKGRCSHCAKHRVNGIQNSGVDVGEMQLVANGTHQDVWTENENNNHSVSLRRLGGSLHAEMEVTSTESAATESGSDEIFVISAGPGVGTLHFSSFKTKVPKRSPTGSSPVSDWRLQQFLTADEQMGQVARQGTGRADSPTGQRASGRDIARLPLTDWCDWTSTGPFAQLTENCALDTLTSDPHVVNHRKVVSDMRLEADGEQVYSDSAGSAASYPLSRSAQSQRKVNSATNLRRTWFGSPCFGFGLNVSRHGSCGHKSAPHSGTLPGSSVTNDGTKSSAAKPRALPTESDRLNLPKPVFVISEAREDREPLVQAAEAAGHRGDIGHFEEIHPNTSSPALEGERLAHPVSGTT